MPLIRMKCFVVSGGGRHRQCWELKSDYHLPGRRVCHDILSRLVRWCGERWGISELSVEVPY